MFQICVQPLLGTKALCRLDQRALGFFGDLGFHAVECSGTDTLRSLKPGSQPIGQRKSYVGLVENLTTTALPPFFLRQLNLSPDPNRVVPTRISPDTAGLRTTGLWLP